MSIYLILSICLLSICVCIGLCMLVLRKKFITIFPSKNEKQNFNRCILIPSWIFVIETALTLASFILIICDCILGNTMNETSQIWTPCMLAGIVIGEIVGLIYWHKVKEPFFRKNFPQQYSDYEKEVKKMWAPYRVRYYESAVIGNFLWPIYSTCTLIGIILVIVL